MGFRHKLRCAACSARWTTFLFPERGVGLMYHSPDNPLESLPPALGCQQRIGFSLTELLVSIAAISTIVALVLPTLRLTRESERRSLCEDHLLQIGQALLMYESTYHALPPAATVDAKGKPLQSWRTLILPFLGQRELYDSIDFSRAWDDPVNRAAYESCPDVFRCPSGHGPSGQTSYLAVIASRGCFRKQLPREISEIRDDPAQTLMVLEVAPQQGVHWMSPVDADEQILLSFVSDEGLAHQTGRHALFVNGNVQFLSSNLPVARLREMISIADNSSIAPRKKQ